jgi:hypothetical protein
MPVRIYDIAKKLGVENKVVLAKAKELGIAHAKVPSSSLDKITAAYLEEQMGGVAVQPSETAPPPQAPEPVILVTAHRRSPSSTPDPQPPAATNEHPAEIAPACQSGPRRLQSPVTPHQPTEASRKPHAV